MEGYGPRFTTADQAFLASASRILGRERWMSFLVAPDTLTRWYRQLLSGRRRSSRRPGRPPLDPGIKALVLRLDGRTRGGVTYGSEASSSTWGSTYPGPPSPLCSAMAASDAPPSHRAYLGPVPEAPGLRLVSVAPATTHAGFMAAISVAIIEALCRIATHRSVCRTDLDRR